MQPLPDSVALRERQLQSNSQGQSSSKDTKGAAPDAHALARLRVRRETAVGTAHEASGIRQHSQDARTADVPTIEPSRRLQAQVITTAGWGMQREAPSRISSVRGSLEQQQQQQEPLHPRATGVGAVAAAFSSSAALRKPDNGAPVGAVALAPCGTACGGRSPATAPGRLRGAAGRRTTTAAGTACALPQCPGANSNTLGRADTAAGSFALGTWAQSISTGMALRPHCTQAGKDGTAASRLGSCMGCGMPWQQLWDAVAGARERVPQQPGGQLQQRRQAQQHRQRVAQLVVLQWWYYSSSKAQLRAADGLYMRRLMAAAWQALSCEVRRMQLLAGRANLQATKHAFGLLSRAFSSWHQQVILLKRLELVVDTVQAHKQRQVCAAVLLDWREWVLHKRRQRQLLLRAEACHVFVTMLRALQQWRARTTDKQLARLQAARADQHWQQVVCSHVMHCWRGKAARGAAKWQALAKALCFHKQQLLSRALQAWALAVQQQQEARAAAEGVLGLVAQALQLQCAAGVLQQWQQAAQLQVEHRQLLALAAARRQQRTQQQMLQQWQQLVLYHHQLADASSVLQQLEPRLWLAHSLRRWRCVVQVLAGQRCDELRELVQLRACLGTWLSFTHRRRHTAARLSAATAALARLKLSRLLPAWAEATAQQLRKQAALEAAQQHYQAQLLRHTLLTWQAHAAEAVVERLQEAAAAELHRLRLLTAGLSGLGRYSRYHRLKAAAPDHYQHRLLTTVLAAWRDRAAAKQHMEQQRRLAVRHSYLSTLHRGLLAWQLLLAAAVEKRQMFAAAEQHHGRRVLRAVLKAWRGPVVQLLRHKRSQQSAADAFARQHLLHRCVGVWTAAVAARHAKQAQLATALHLRQHNLLMKGWQGFLLLQQDTQHERRELAAAAAPALRVLNRLKQRWMLRAWLAAAQQQQQERALAQRAAAHARRCRLTQCLGVWQQYLAYRRRKAVQAGRAAAHRGRLLRAAGVSALRQQVSHAAGKRQRVFAAALHRRGWLLWRAYRSWRLETTVSHLERIVSHPSALHPAMQKASLSSHSSSTNSKFMGPPAQPWQGQQLRQQRGGPEVEAVAATVVEASCAAHREWQQHWRSKWQQVMTEQLQPQQPAGDWQQSGALQLSLTASQQQQQVPPGMSTFYLAGPPACSMQQLTQNSVSSAGPEGPWALVAVTHARAYAHTAEAWSSSSAGAPSSSTKRAARRAPRLPAFLQAGLPQPQQSASELEPARLVVADQQLPQPWLTAGNAQQQQQQQVVCFGGDTLPQPPALTHPLPPPIAGAPAGTDAVCPPSAVAASMAAPASAACGVSSSKGSCSRHVVVAGSFPNSCLAAPAHHPTPAVPRRVRQQPRQLRPSLLDTESHQAGSRGSLQELLRHPWGVAGPQEVVLQHPALGSAGPWVQQQQQPHLLSQVLVVNPQVVDNGLGGIRLQQQQLALGQGAGVVLD